MDERIFLGGAFANIIIGKPYEIVTESYLESMNFETYDFAEKHAKYLMTKFLRALLYLNKNSRHSTTSWQAIPIQDFSEEWWDESIEVINEKLFEKYNIPLKIREFVNKNFQPKNEDSIINFEK